MERAGAGIWAEAEEGTRVRAGAGVPALDPISLQALAPVPPPVPPPTSASTPAPVRAPALARGFCPGPGSCLAKPRPCFSPALFQPTPALLQPHSSSAPALALSCSSPTCSSPAPAYSSPASVSPSSAPVPPSPMLQSLPVELRHLWSMRKSAMLKE